MTEQEARNVLRTKFQHGLLRDPSGEARYMIYLLKTKDVVAGSGFTMTLEDVAAWIDADGPDSWPVP